MTRWLVLSTTSTVVVLGVVWGFQPGRYFVADVRHSYDLDAAIGLALLCGFTFAAAWLGSTGRGTTSDGATGARPATIRTFPLLWAGFAASIFFLMCAAEWGSSSRGSYFDRLLDRSFVGATTSELVGQ